MTTTIDETSENFQYGTWECDVKINIPDNHNDPITIRGVAVTTDVSNGQRFPLDVLKRDIKTLIGQPIVDHHSDFPVRLVNRDYLGEVTNAWVNEEKNQAEFEGEIFDAKAKEIVRRFPKRVKFSVGYRHTYDFDEKKVRVTNKSLFDHLGLLDTPADEKSILTQVKNSLGENWSVVAEGKSAFWYKNTTDTNTNPIITVGLNPQEKNKMTNDNENVDAPVVEPVVPEQKAAPVAAPAKTEAIPVAEFKALQDEKSPFQK